MNNYEKFAAARRAFVSELKNLFPNSPELKVSIELDDLDASTDFLQLCAESQKKPSNEKIYWGEYQSIAEAEQGVSVEINSTFI